jgi:foldase protein PrsA
LNVRTHRRAHRDRELWVPGKGDRSRVGHVRKLLTIGLPSVAIALTGCGGSATNSVVATVGGKPISKGTYERWLAIEAAGMRHVVEEATLIPDPPDYASCIAQLRRTPSTTTKAARPRTPELLKAECKERYEQLQRSALGFLITAEWELAAAPGLGVHVSESEVKSDFEESRRHQFPKPADFRRYLKLTGQNMPDVLFQIKVSILHSDIEQKLQAKASREEKPVTETEIAAAYQKRKASFNAPEDRTVEVIATRTRAAALTAKRELHARKSFASLAKHVSIAPNAKLDEGLLTHIVGGQLPGPVGEAVFKSKPNNLVGPVRSASGFYLFEVLATYPAHHESLAQARSSISEELAAEQRERGPGRAYIEFATHWRSRTDCRPGYMVEDCNGYKPPPPRLVKPPGNTSRGSGRASKEG